MLKHWLDLSDSAVTWFTSYLHPHIHSVYINYITLAYIVLNMDIPRIL